MASKRNTEQKEILIKYLKEHKNEHLTIKQISLDLKNNLGLTTIYRIINSLIEEGTVTKIPFENKQGYCYRYNSFDNNCKNHYHLICEKCNKLYHFESKEVEKLNKEAIDEEGFEINNDRVIFYGICKNCK